MMNRLTKQNGIGEYEAIRCFECGSGAGPDNENCGMCDVAAAVENLLGEYENTNLTPSQIEALKGENERLKMERDMLTASKEQWRLRSEELKRLVRRRVSPCEVCSPWTGACDGCSEDNDFEQFSYMVRGLEATTCD